MKRLAGVMVSAGVLAGSIPAATLGAQNPTPQQVQQALQTKPGAGQMVRSRILQSGLTPEQVRQRLQAAGYPAGLLDSYMPGSVEVAGAAGPDDSVMKAATFLGLVDAQESAAEKGGGSAVAPVTAPPPATAKREPGIFGLDVFRRSSSQFQPDLAGPVDPSYKVGPRDVLALIITGEIETSYTLEVTREGFVVVPQVGQVFVANLTLDQVTDALFPRLRRVYSGIGRDQSARTHFYITVAKLRTNQVFVIGEASAPASYQVSSAGTMLTALYGAGGPSDNGTMRGIELRRAGKVAAKLDVYDYLLNGDASRDARLETGDVVFIPIHGARITISGEVVRPAVYELTGSETLRDLIRMAGGFTAEAARRRVLVRRVVPPAERTPDGGRDRTVIDITSDEFRAGSGPAFPLSDGDAVEVLSVADRVRNRISVEGAVWSPGFQGFVEGMTVSQAIRRAGGVKPDVKDILVSRLQSDQTRSSLRVAFLDTLGRVDTDIALQEDDEVRVFATSDFRPERHVVITGAVNKGGRVPWREGMTLKDLVHLSGGLADGAYLVQAEVTRLPESREKGTIGTTLTVPLDSSYLLERGIDGKYLGPPGVRPTEGGVSSFLLKPYDNVLIFRQPDWDIDQTVFIRGEIQFEGTYSLLNKEERLSSLIRRAGGLTPRAYLNAVVFTRTRGGVGRIALDVAAAIRSPGSRDDIVLAPGDSIAVPSFDPTVKVEGAVHSPIAVTYSRGKKLSYYIQAAGGVNYLADEARAYVRQPRGTVDPYKWRWFLIPDRDPVPLPGSVVVVPAKDPADKKDWTSITASWAQILVSAVAILAVSSR